jgi:exosome complex RNA-binding protein Rrp42 (RNase PH superfamily)
LKRDPFWAPQNGKKTEFNPQEFISVEGLRLDGRRANELRHIFIKLGVVENADGSAYFEQVSAYIFNQRETPNF